MDGSPESGVYISQTNNIIIDSNTLYNCGTNNLSSIYLDNVNDGFINSNYIRRGTEVNYSIEILDTTTQTIVSNNNLINNLTSNNIKISPPNQQLNNYI